MGALIPSRSFTRRALVVAVAAVVLFLTGGSAAAGFVDILNDSVEHADLLVNGSTDVQVFRPGNSAILTLRADFESGKTDTYPKAGFPGTPNFKVPPGGGGLGIQGNGDERWDAPNVTKPTWILLRATLTSEYLDFYSDTEQASAFVLVLPKGGVAPKPKKTAFAAPDPSLNTVVAVTLNNPFPQELAVYADSLASPGQNGTVNSQVFDPFSDALSRGGPFTIAPNSSVTADIGITFPSSQDQDFVLGLSGKLADGTSVTTPELRWDAGNGTSTLAGTFQVAPEPSAIALLLSGIAAVAGHRGYRRLRSRLGRMA
jgi:hypothetical protein